MIPKPRPEENVNDVIHNLENEIELYKFHLETLTMKIENHLRPKIQSDIHVVQTTKQDSYLPTLKTAWTEKDIESRIEYFYAYDELIKIIHTINSKKLALGMYQFELQKSEEAQLKGIDKHKIATLVSEAKGLLKKDISDEDKEKLRQSISHYEKGVYMQDQMVFFKRLQNLIFEIK